DGRSERLRRPAGAPPGSLGQRRGPDRLDRIAAGLGRRSVGPARGQAGVLGAAEAAGGDDSTIEPRVGPKPGAGARTRARAVAAPGRSAHSISTPSGRAGEGRRTPTRLARSRERSDALLAATLRRAAGSR